MKIIKLKQLRIENFKGCREQTFGFSNTTNIYGENGAGKTTLMDAFMWLLFDKDSSGASKFNIRPVNSDGKMVDNVEILVEAVLEVDGRALTLQKVQKQNWVKQRGSDTAKLQGNVNTYEVDTFPVSEKEFKERISSIISEELFKLLTDPKGFASLPWKKQREIVMRFISTLTDQDILNTDTEKYSPIADEIQQAPVEKCIEKAKKAMAKLKERQKELPARIDEASKSLAQIPDLAEMELQRNALKEQLDDVQRQRDDIGQAYKLVEDIRGQIMNTKFEMSGIAQNADAAVKREKREARNEYDDLTYEANRLYEKRKTVDKEIEKLKGELDTSELKRSKLGEEYERVKSEDMSENAVICPTCGQNLPEERIVEIKADFASNKKRRINEIISAGNAAKQKSNALKEQIVAKESELEQVKAQWNEKAAAQGKAYEYMNNLPMEADLSMNQEYQALQNTLSSLEAQLSSMDTGEGVKQQLSIGEKGIREELDALNRKFAAVDANERVQERIEELQEEQRMVSQQVADQERKIYLLEEFSRAKIEMLSSAINNNFKLVCFKMFEMQINGGMKETCEMTVDGVPYSSLNSAAKLQAGLDVINSLSELYGISVPIWIDNRESVSEIPGVNAQVINLYVSPTDKELRIEEAA